MSTGASTANQHAPHFADDGRRIRIACVLLWDPAVTRMVLAGSATGCKWMTRCAHHAGWGIVAVLLISKEYYYFHSSARDFHVDNLLDPVMAPLCSLGFERGVSYTNSRRYGAVHPPCGT